MSMNDQQASSVIEALLHLAVSVRDDGPVDVADAAREVLAAADADPVAALAIAAALIRVDEPVDTWWTRGLAGVGHASPPDLERPEPTPRKDPTPDPRCGTRPGYLAHTRRGENPCRPCITANSDYQSERYQSRREAAQNPQAA